MRRVFPQSGCELFAPQKRDERRPFAQIPSVADSKLRPNRYERQASSQKTAETLTFLFNRVEFRS
jgi:hypothetical protein